MNTGSPKTDKEILTTNQRWAELLIAGSLLLLFGFFAYHQLANTGFFTSKFGSFEMVCLYIPILIALTAPLLRAMIGFRNPARPFEAAGNLCLACGSLWLLVVFPFNYTHLADVLPTGMRFLLAWLTDDIARFILALQVIIGIGSALALMWQYFTRRGQMLYVTGR